MTNHSDQSEPHNDSAGVIYLWNIARIKAVSTYSACMYSHRTSAFPSTMSPRWTANCTRPSLQEDTARAVQLRAPR